MRIIFVRHGEPDYEHDSLTEKGWREAALLADRISQWNVTEFYTSPLGRAKDTASCTLNKLNRSAVTLDYMREFSYHITDPLTGKYGVPWDYVPSDWTSDSRMFDMDAWAETERMKESPVIPTEYKKVWNEFDKLLASYGYIREDKYYRCPDKEERFRIRTPKPIEMLQDGFENGTHPNSFPTDTDEPTIVIFCHLGIICLVLSHLLNIPFQLLTHGFFLPTTSLTILTSEERWSNEAYFRVQAMGDVNHLLHNGEPVSSAGAFAKAFQG